MPNDQTIASGRERATRGLDGTAVRLSGGAGAHLPAFAAIGRALIGRQPAQGGATHGR